jgi:hypothetical protein
MAPGPLEPSGAQDPEPDGNWKRELPVPGRMGDFETRRRRDWAAQPDRRSATSRPVGTGTFSGSRERPAVSATVSIKAAKSCRR